MFCNRSLVSAVRAVDNARSISRASIAPNWRISATDVSISEGVLANLMPRAASCTWRMLRWAASVLSETC